MSEEEARKWPDLMAIVEEKVKPIRAKDNRKAYRRFWWQFAEKRAGLHAAIHGLERVLACSLHQPRWAIAFSKTGAVFSHALGVMAVDTYSAFCVLQSCVHEVWARFFG